MARSELRGKHYEVKGDSITIFGCLGGHHGAHWVLGMTLEDGTTLPYMTQPTPLSGQVVSVIAADTAAGRDHLIRYVLISPQMAVSLFLEGILTFQHFVKVDEWDHVVLLESVVIHERAWDVMIGAAPDYNAVTVDANGQIV